MTGDAPTSAAAGEPELDAGLDAALRELVDAVRTGWGALVALDFDGVLAPLGDDPAASRALPASVTALADLAAVRGLHLALVSGRALDDLVSCAQVPPGTWLVGSHGAEPARWTGELEREAGALDDDARALRDTLAAEVDRLVEGTAARAEHKPTAVVLHTRTASRPDAARLTAAALALGERPGVDVLRGKEVVELAVVHVTKGDALALLRSRTGAQALLYAGDDVTDERAFAVLGPRDVTVKVGEGPTAARFRVGDPEAVAALLSRLVGLLTSGGDRPAGGTASGRPS